MQATHIADLVTASPPSAARIVSRTAARTRRPTIAVDSIAWLFVMPITLALLVVFSILFPLRW